MKKPLTSVGAFCYIDSIENNEEYIMKYLLLALSLLATPCQMQLPVLHLKDRLQP